MLNNSARIGSSMSRANEAAGPFMAVRNTRFKLTSAVGVADPAVPKILVDLFL
jgi:hypothetical protein